MRGKVDAHERNSQQSFKQHYDRHVRKTAIYRLYEYIFLDRPPLVAAKDQDANQLYSSTYHMLLPRRTGPFHIIIVQSKTVTINKHDILNTFCVDHAVHAPVMLRNAPNDHAPPSDNPIDESRDEYIHRARSYGNADHEYAVDHIVRHVGKGTQHEIRCTIVRIYTS